MISVKPSIQKIGRNRNRNFGRSLIVPQHNIQRRECLSHVGKRITGHLIDHQKDKLKHARASEKLEKQYLTKEGRYTAKARKQLDAQFRGQLVRKNDLRGTWEESPAAPISTKFQSKRFHN